MKIVKIQRSFFWAGGNGEKKIFSIVKWSSIELPKELGGLGVGNIMYKNLILLFKWWWRYSESDNVLWKRILMSVYDLKHLKASSAAFSKAQVGSWSHMMKNDVVTSKIRSIVEQGMVLSVGRGDSILFWHDKWCELGPLKASFPRLFCLSTQKNLFITHMGSWHEGSWSWNLRWRRQVFDWEQEEIQRLSQAIGHIQPNNESADGVFWRFSGNTSFHVKSISDKLYESSPPLISKQAIASIWQSQTPPQSPADCMVGTFGKTENW